MKIIQTLNNFFFSRSNPYHRFDRGRITIKFNNGPSPSTMDQVLVRPSDNFFPSSIKPFSFLLRCRLLTFHGFPFENGSMTRTWWQMSPTCLLRIIYCCVHGCMWTRIDIVWRKPWEASTIAKKFELLCNLYKQYFCFDEIKRVTLYICVDDDCQSWISKVAYASWDNFPLVPCFTLKSYILVKSHVWYNMLFSYFSCFF